MNENNQIAENIGKVIEKVKKNAINAESYNTGLIGEQLIVSAYKTMPLDKLIKLRFIMNKIIKKKKELKRINSSR